MKSNKREKKRTECLNCRLQLRLDDEFCPACGQKNIDKSISMKELILDFFGDYFAFDSKLFNTILPLILKPGKVALDFVQGQRIRHIPPLRIYIFSSFLFFFINGVLPSGEEETPSGTKEMELFEGVHIALFDKIEMDSIRHEASKVNLNIHDFLKRDTSLSNFAINYALVPEMMDQGFTPKQCADSLCKDVGFFETRFIEQAGKIYNTDTATTSNYFVGNISISILLFQPIFALILSLFYFRRRMYFINHLVFSFYLHALLAILFTMSIVLDVLFDTDLITSLSILIAVVYFFFSIKNFYTQKTWITLVKSILITFLYLILLTPLTFLSSIIFSFFFF